eukprot:COSAG01_NODE_58966_length_303_cov_0.450980_1_plen_41_part_10
MVVGDKTAPMRQQPSPANCMENSETQNRVPPMLANFGSLTH